MSLVCPKEVLLGYGNPLPLAEGCDFPLHQRSSTAVRPRVIARSCKSSDVAIRFPWQKAVMFRRTLGAAGQQSLPRRRKVRELRFRLWGEKLRSLPFSSFPHRTRYAGLRRGPL